jgi:receptor-type tyrosine-protein phosphatase F
MKISNSIVPGAPPKDIFCNPTSPTTIKCSWSPPPQDRSNGRIVYYKIFFVEEGRSDTEADSVKLNTTEFVMDELKRWTEYKIWVLAGTSVGDGPKSYPLTVQTHEDGMYFIKCQFL